MAKSTIGKNYGWKRDLPDHRDLICSVEHVDASTLPQSVDLRSKMPPVWDQGELGSCTAHGLGAAFEYDQKRQHPDWDYAPSRLFIYFCERVLEGTTNSDSGAQIRTGAKVLNSQGVCKESLWPYDIAKFKNKPSAAAYKNAAIHKSVKYQRVAQTETSMKAVLASGSPIVIGFSVYESFESDVVANTGIVPMPAATERCLGGHCVLVAGYDDSKQMFLIRNSWGTGWGLEGYCWMPYGYLLDPNLADDFWVIQQVS